LAREKVNYYFRSRGVHQRQQTNACLRSVTSFGIRHFSSSTPEEKQDDNSFEEDERHGETESVATGDGGEEWDENNFSHLIQRKYNQSAAPTDTTASITDVTDVPWEPVYYNPLDLVIESLRWIHDTTGLEYAWCVVSLVALIRLGLFPLQAIALRNNSRIAEIGWIRQKLSANLNLQDPAHRTKLAQETKALMDQYGVKSIYSVLPQIVTVPFAVAFVMGFSKMSTVFHDDLATGGALWFPDLTAPDPYYILPVINAVTYLGVTEWVRNQTYDPFSPTTSRTYFRRVLAFLFIPLGATLSSAMVLSWETFYLISVGHVVFFQSPAAKKWLGLWETPHEQTNRIVGNAVLSTTRPNAVSGKEATQEPPKKRPIRRGGRKR
jgi:membrane protein insertase Oxa1/YidC/SpoIIIJ